MERMASTTSCTGVSGVDSSWPWAPKTSSAEETALSSLGHSEAHQHPWEMLRPLQACQPRPKGVLQLPVCPLYHNIALRMVGCCRDVVYIQPLA